MAEKEQCVFIVDDNPVNLNAGKAALQENYLTVTIPSGDKLLLALEQTKPDLILLDINMPGMSGYDVLRILKANPALAEIPVIFLTGKNDAADELLGFTLGAVDYITKPFSAPLLLKRVEAQLQLQSQKQALLRFNHDLLGLVNDRIREVLALQNALISWAAEVIEFRNQETGQHVERVKEYLTLLLGAMGEHERYAEEIATWDIEAFLRSSLLHDVGKIKIGDAILLKPAKLSDLEFKEMQQHTSYGKELLDSLRAKVPDDTFLIYAAAMAYYHHERWDGTGYPDRLRGEAIPLMARMMALADVYDALISKRPYKPPFSHEEAMQIISAGRGTHFDPELTDLFMKLSPQIAAVGG